MTKKLLISAVIVLFSIATFAEETDTLLTFEADSALLERYSKVNDYSLLGIDYSVSMARASFNPNRMQQSVFMPVNFGITYTKYCRMFGYMPYFGLQIGLQYANEAYQFKANAVGVVDYINYAYKATIQTIEVPVMAHLHYDFWKMKIMVNLGAYAGYRLSIHREYVDGLLDKYKEYEDTFHPLENRFDYGIKGGAGLGLILDPIEIHFMCYYKYSLSNLHQPDINNRTMERDEYSKYYYRWSYPTNLIFSLGIHYQLSRRNGRARGKNVGFSSNDERENTLNQLLTEMDGFASNSGVIVMAATNRADILDQALMRAGRFDRQIHVDLPDLNERKEIFNVHLKGLKLSKDFDLEFLAKHTPGFSGADIANVCNEAALVAARRDKQSIEKQDFLDAVDRIIGGLEKKGKIITPAEKRSIAYHEAGHATISWLLPHANPLFKVTIVPRGSALGAAWYLPEEHVLMTKEQMVDEMCGLIGGRVAEEIVNGSVSSGALNDLERLTKMAYGMVTYYGMSDRVGNISFYDSTGARGYDLTKPYSEKTAELIDEEVKRIVAEVHDRSKAILEENREGFEKLAAKLLEEEVIFSDDVEAIFGPKVGGKPEETAEADKQNNTKQSDDETAA